MTTRQLLSVTKLVGDRVRNPKGENLGKIEDLMIDTSEGRIGYAVLSFGGFIGIGDKLFAIPWAALRLDQDDGEFILDVDKEVLKSAPGFDRDQWPDFADPRFAEQIHSHYGSSPYWVSAAVRR